MIRIPFTAWPAALLAVPALLARTAAAQPPAQPTSTEAARAAVGSSARSVRFEGPAGGSSYEVAVEGICYEVSSGEMIPCQRACKAPCDVTLVPGSYHVRVSGDSSFGDEVEVSSATSVVRIEHRTGPGPFVMALGAAVVGAGLWMRSAPLTPCDPATGCRAGTFRNADLRRSARAVMIGGGVGIVAGIALLAAIHDRLVVDSPNVAVAQKAPAPALVGISVAPTKGGVSAGAGVSF